MHLLSSFFEPSSTRAARARRIRSGAEALGAQLVWALGLLVLTACGDSARAAHKKRLALQGKETQAAEHREMEFGHSLDVLRAVRTRLKAAAGKSLILTSDGALNVLSLRAYHQWNSTQVGKDRPRAADFDNPDHPIHEILSRAEMLNAAGVDYLFVVVPSRVEIYPELLVPDLADAPDFPGMNPGMFAFQAELSRQGVETVPLLEKFVADRFTADGVRWLSLRAQPAWTPAGVALAARALADVVRELPWFRQGPALEGVDYVVDRRTISPTTVLPPELAGQPGFDKPEVLPIEAVLTRESLPAHVPDRESEIVLIGDSAVSIYEQLGGDLSAQLYRLLGCRIDVISAASGDYWATFEHRPEPLEGKKLVIEVQSNGFRMPPTPHAPLPAN